jgi:hypothetical protein
VSVTVTDGLVPEYRTSTAMKLPAPFAAGNASDADAVVPASTLRRCCSVITVVAPTTVNPTPLLVTPPTVTVTGPLVAPPGTVATIRVALQLIVVAAVPLNRTVLLPAVAPKFAPSIVTAVPGPPDAGNTLAIVGAGGGGGGLVRSTDTSADLGLARPLVLYAWTTKK